MRTKLTHMVATAALAMAATAHATNDAQMDKQQRFDAHKAQVSANLEARAHINAQARACSDQATSSEELRVCAQAAKAAHQAQREQHRSQRTERRGEYKARAEQRQTEREARRGERKNHTQQ